jgi:hypothetical protein
MNKTEGLVDAVIEQILIDVQNEDMTALAELLTHVPEEYLVGFLSNI